MDLRNAVLIPIDVQRGFDFPPWGRRNNPGMEDNGRALLAGWRQAGKPIIHIRHDSVWPNSPLRPEHEGNAFRPGFEPKQAEPVVPKSVNCAFLGTDLDLRLRRAKANTVVLFGVSTDMCVSTTARIASNMGYQTVIVSDACFCFDQPFGDGRVIPAEAIQDAHLATLQAEFGAVVETAQIIDALRRRAA